MFFYANSAEVQGSDYAKIDVRKYFAGLQKTILLSTYVNL